MSENKTKPTSVRVEDFLKTLGSDRQKEAEVLIDLMHRISAEQPVMWGPSIIGFGSQHYKSEAGREGDMSILGFSPRKTALTVYFYEGFDRYGVELNTLGKHKTSRACLYINRLTDIDLTTLEKMLESSYTIATTENISMNSVEDYIESVPKSSRQHFDELRELVKSELEGAHEVISYGIVGYKPNPKKRAVVFISGWRDHIAVYPVPKNDDLKSELSPYIKGKGTLWFSLTEPLPKELIRKVVRALK